MSDFVADHPKGSEEIMYGLNDAITRFVIPDLISLPRT